MSVSFSNLLTPTNLPTNDRLLQDALVSATVALPATAALANTGNINLQVATPYPTTETINVLVSTTASANGNSVNGTIVLQDAATNSDGTANTTTWANIATLGTVKIVEGASATVATSNTFKLPPGCRQFIRAQAQLVANTADLSDSNMTIKLLF
jgi:hypothetical protein